MAEASNNPEFEDPLNEGLESSGAHPLEEPISDAHESDVSDNAMAGGTPEPSTDTVRDARPRESTGPKKPWFDTYTAMLGMAVLATIVATVFLALHMGRYDWQIEPHDWEIEPSAAVTSP